MDVAIDDETLNELYMPPFRASVRAGVLGVMCSYNKVRGDHACENDGLLNKKLKVEFAFRGFVVSDWWATHSTARSILNGLDIVSQVNVHLSS